MDGATLVNVLAYAAQVACIALIGSALPALLRLDVPAVRYTYWRAVVALCLALPWLQGRVLPHPAGAAGAGGSAGTETSVNAVGAAAAQAAALAVNWPAVIATVLIGGAALRLAWTAAGFIQLRRLRHAGVVADPTPESDELQRILGTRAQIRHVSGLHQPVTFGLLRPVVLLPDTLASHPPEIRTAVLAHELVHVQRRDWAWILVEEVVAAAFWFHPAMWWLLSRVQLAREEVVDELAVTITGKRRTYVEALLAFADTPPLAPAPAFARRRHLFHRVVLISKEAMMSSKRVVLSCAVMALVVAAGGWYAVDAFPMQQQPAGGAVTGRPGPLEQTAKTITPENPIPRRLNHSAADYPPEAAAIAARATVTLRVTLDSTGRVAEVRWVAISTRIPSPAMSLHFTAPINIATRNAAVQQLSGGDPTPVINALDAMTNAAIEATRTWSYDPPADAPISFNVTIGFSPDAPSTSAQSAPSPAGVVGGPSVKPHWTADGALRVGGGVKVPTKIRDVKPVYPEEAKAARVQGVVIIEARIEPDGTVGNARVLRSIEMLNQAALDAVMQWQFLPTLMNGQAVPVIMTVTVNFTLQ
jgi:TonB family protein